ncbi:hypothetical protein Tco_0147490 [Tanacetum coccineum]
MTVAGARETVNSQVVQKPKREKDYTYHKEKMLLCKQAKKGIPLQAKQADWLEEIDEEIVKQELEAHVTPPFLNIAAEANLGYYFKVQQS